VNDTSLTKTRTSDAVLDSLVSLGQAIEQRMDEAAQPLGLSVAKLGVLHALVQKGEPVPLGALSRDLHCVKSNITQLVDRLEADKLVRRVPDPEDRRSVLAAITEEGRRQHNAGWQAVEEARQQFLRGLSKADRKQLLHLLQRLQENESH
jgi:DNA-binding MarR family transcriptional regulator